VPEKRVSRVENSDKNHRKGREQDLAVSRSGIRGQGLAVSFFQQFLVSPDLFYFSGHEHSRIPEFNWA